MILIPLHARDGSVRDYAAVDDIDADLGQVSWSLGSAGYAQRQTQRGSRKGPAVRKTVMLSLHRAIAQRMGIDDAPMVDHEDRDKLNCRRHNLRPADALLNARNRPRGLGPAPQTIGCSEPGCDAKHYAKGQCRRHWFRGYQRAWRAAA
jgi:hypothetical protein